MSICLFQHTPVDHCHGSLVMEHNFGIWPASGTSRTVFRSNLPTSTVLPSVLLVLSDRSNADANNDNDDNTHPVQQATMAVAEGIEFIDSDDERQVLPENVQVHVLSFCDASDFLSLQAFFRETTAEARVAHTTTKTVPALPDRFLTVAGVNAHLADTECLGLSYLLRACPNTFQDDNDSQERAVTSLIEVAVKATPHDDHKSKKEDDNGKEKEAKLKHLELANLRSVTGVGWLQLLSKVSLVSLDLTNCERLNPELLALYLDQCPTILRYLNLSGCTRVGPDIVSTIGTKHYE